MKGTSTMKLWSGRFGKDTDALVNELNASISFDQRLYKEDITGSMAHAAMLADRGIISREDTDAIIQGLRGILADAEAGKIAFTADNEDIHMNVEALLAARIGEAGKRLHTARSRNDQVALDFRMYVREQIPVITGEILGLMEVLCRQAGKYQTAVMPGYTHLQVAMPSSFGLWFAAYAESLADDLIVMQAAYRVCNRNPLGSAAGYGSSFPLNRTQTTDSLGFETMDYNVVYAQMGRGKTERIVASAIASIAATLAKLAFDACLYNSQNFAFIKLPDAFTTGSSIMPHKKNPDVFELTRAKCNKLQALPYQITLIANNLPSGYFRDLQIIKELFLPSFDELEECLDMVDLMISQIAVNEHILDDKRYDYMFSVEEVNRRVQTGTPFRDAYKQVGLEIEAGKFSPDKHIRHTHEGSIGNLCNDRITELMRKTIDSFDFARTEAAEARLLGR